MMSKITEKLLSLVSDWQGGFSGAYNIREDGMCAGRLSTEHIQIESKTDKRDWTLLCYREQKAKPFIFPPVSPMAILTTWFTMTFILAKEPM